MEEIKLYLEKYFLEIGYKHISENIGLYLGLFTVFVTTLVPVIVKLIKIIFKYFRQRKAVKDLHPFYLPNEVRAATNFFIKTRCQNVTPADCEELDDNHAFTVQSYLMPFFLKSAFKFKKGKDNRFYFVLSDSGMGKTTFLINLFIKYSNKIKKSYKIKLFPLGYKGVDSEIENIKIEDRRNTILLLDAFDEDLKASNDYKKRLDELVNLVWDFRIVVITCRTQFFASDKDEPSDTSVMKFGGEKGFLSFRKIYISPFSDNDIKKYLKKKFSILKFKKRKKGFEIVRNCPNLMVRPMLLSYIEDLLTYKFKIRNASQSYEALIEKWIEREAQRIERERRDNFKIELRKFSDELALDIYKKREQRGGLFITSNELQNLSERNKINLNSIEMKSRSLLNRHSTGYYKFSHRSILEYILARRIYTDKSSLGNIDIKTFDQAYKFYLEILWNNIEINRRDLSLDLSHRLLYKVMAISGFSNLKLIELNNNYISDISILKSCKYVQALRLDNNYIIDISCLKELKELKILHLRGNKISDISSLFELENLTELDLTSNPISDEQVELLKSKLPHTEIVFRK